MIRTKVIDGDSYAEIIRNKEGIFINLKSLAPDSIVSVWNSKGRILRYEQVNKIRGIKNRLFKPDEIFHLMNNKMAEETHGTNKIPAIEETI